MMTTVPSNDALARKLRSEAHLAQLNVPFDTALPPLPNAWSSIVRTPEAIAARAICLCLCAAKAEGLEQATVADLVVDFGVGRYLRPPETTFLYGQSEDEQQARRFQWGYEACYALLWVLGRMDALRDPTACCDPQQVAGVITGAGSIEGLVGAARRSEEVLDAADLTYRFLDTCRQAGPPYQQVPGGLICAVVHQRQHAFQWLLDPERPHWEDVLVPL